jgi:putative sterol carrier protein
MADATSQFFDDLGQRGHEPLLGKTTGTLRFDLQDGKRTDRWLVVMKEGDVKVSRKNGSADCVVRTDKALFDGLVTGELHTLTTFLRGVMTVEGDGELMVLFQRLFPSPPTARGKRHVAGYARRHR